MTSLCPSLGKQYAQKYKGECPAHLNHPYGKTINISFIGISPYVSYNPIGGSAFIVTKLLAKKFKFMPKFIPERSWDIAKRNNISFGMLHRVRLLCDQTISNLMLGR